MITKLLKSIIICLALLAFAGSLLAQNPFSPYNETKPNGNIYSVSIIYGNAEGQHIYIYNKDRQLIEDVWYRGDVPDTIQTQFCYGVNKHLVSGIRIYKGSKSLAHYQYFVRKYGYAIRMMDAPDNDTSLVYEMHFNHAGQMIRSGYFARDSLEAQRPGNIGYRYDKEGNMIERITYTQRPDPNRVFYKYNNRGDEVEVIRPAGQDYSRKSTYKYSSYDKLGNWTQRTVDFVNAYEDNDSIHHERTVIRHITYYK